MTSGRPHSRACSSLFRKQELGSHVDDQGTPDGTGAKIPMDTLSSIQPAFVWFGLVMKENTYLSRVVKIDEERGHHVIATGPYAFVRHPMYSAVVVMLLAFPIALGSWLGLAPAAAMVILLIVRTALDGDAEGRTVKGSFTCENHH